MATYRTFRNIDPPTIAALWQRRAGQPGLWQPVSPDLLEQLVFSRLYFDPAGLTLAFDGERPVGFAHAGFGPNAELTAIDAEQGVTCLVMIEPGADEATVADGLLERSEAYLRGRGAKVLYGGGLAPISPFYLGLYGGCELPGVLDSDTVARAALAARGYEEAERIVVVRRELSGFEAHIDRQQMQVRRQMLVEVLIDAPTQTWWEACTWGAFDLTRFDVVPRAGGPPIASALFRTIEPGGTVGVTQAAGLLSICVGPAYRRRGLAVFLLNEAFRQFSRQGILYVEAQSPETNAAMLGVFQKLGFAETARGSRWRKE